MIDKLRELRDGLISTNEEMMELQKTIEEKVNELSVFIEQKIAIINEIDNIDINENIDLYTRINCYDKLINNYLEKDTNEYTYNEIKGHFNNLKDVLDKLDKDLYNKIIIEVEFIDYDICADLYKELVNEEYIEDILLDNLDY